MSTYQQSSEGKFIPATKRPDGTWRKARRVKDGYVPQEEVPLYESKGKQFVAQRQTGVPPGMCPILAAESKKELEKQERTRTKKLDKDKEGVAVALSGPSGSSGGSPLKVCQPSSDSKTNVNVISNALADKLKLNVPEDVDTEKQLKKLRKKIREIEQIESRIRAGEHKKLDKDQLDKVKKKAEILKQLSALENSDAVQPKPQS
ncbi:partner of Y14 and mago [Drosophila persimilis]|uniref:partner of Y14 and mago n=1 Tax=Drosophila persimilis TaxID=7234 RepID=UPI000F07C041|nr:partner of Y14 and mago [Drosophila persimilis]